ncbi:glycosyltransferase putative [Entamoeba histolytica]|nr:glycosyltransferase, putative [Entamoeba histolytica KU27]GAT93732.1 glycosyltransferase putative [Entamoeba histolytica]
MFVIRNIIAILMFIAIVYMYFDFPQQFQQISFQHYFIPSNDGLSSPSLINPNNTVTLKLQHYNVSSYVDPSCPEGIDVVWLWVNGSDPTFRKQLEKNGKKGGEGRYRDYNTLQYSIRSVYNFAPFIKHYFIVTMGQTPSFLNTSQFEWNEYTLRIVDHKEIFPNTKDLPVFNSNSLEVSLHNIKNLSSCFLYLNDDMLLGKELKPEHFINSDGKLKVYHNSWKAPDTNRMVKNIWHRSVGNSNELINKHFGKSKTVKHPYVSHHCYFFKRDILKQMEGTWPEQYKETRRHKFREGNDLAIPFMHGAFVVESGQGIYVKEYNYYYGSFTSSRRSNTKLINNIEKKQPQCICINDALEKSSVAVINKETAILNSFLETYYPYPCPFEKYIQFN